MYSPDQSQCNIDVHTVTRYPVFPLDGHSTHCNLSVCTSVCPSQRNHRITQKVAYLIGHTGRILSGYYDTLFLKTTLESLKCVANAPLNDYSQRIVSVKDSRGNYKRAITPSQMSISHAVYPKLNSVYAEPVGFTSV